MTEQIDGVTTKSAEAIAACLDQSYLDSSVVWMHLPVHNEPAEAGRAGRSRTFT
ncbi:unnamed protein product [marine sediment metagenome]|uniref:Uncharacterized protein n=1 Tax=marine sediment metagenome TaxID=412755 RepID=X1ELU9_9ZZZZ